MKKVINFKIVRDKSRQIINLLDNIEELRKIRNDNKYKRNVVSNRLSGGMLSSMGTIKNESFGTFGLASKGIYNKENDFYSSSDEEDSSKKHNQVDINELFTSHKPTTIDLHTISSKQNEFNDSYK